MRVKPDQITRAIRIAKAIGEKIDPAFGRVDMGLDEESPVARRLGSIADIRPVQPYTPRVSGFAAGGDVEPSPYSTPNDLGLYSHAAATVASLPQARGTPEQYRGMLLNKGVKPEELERSGFSDAFSDTSQVDRDALAQHFQGAMPQISERVFGKGVSEDQMRALKMQHSQDVQNWHDEHSASRARGEDFDPDRSMWRNMKDRHMREIADLEDRQTHPYHESYALPGGENYREILLQHEGEEGFFPGVSAHFGGEPNILASLRVKDRTDHEGDKVLHLDELQSDWAQKGRDHGFKGEGERDANNALDAYVKQLNERSGRDATQMWPHAAMDIANDFGEATTLSKLMKAAEIETKNNRMRVERAPYITKTDNWVDLGLKRALVEAAKGGYDKLAWSPGDVHVDRYSLDKHVGQINHTDNEDGTYHLHVVTPNGSDIINEEAADSSRLSSLLGKEMADKIISGAGDRVMDLHDNHRALYKEFHDYEAGLRGKWLERTLSKLEAGTGNARTPEDISYFKELAERSTPEQLANGIGLGDEYRDLRGRYMDSRANLRRLPLGYEDSNRDWRVLSGLDLKVGGQGMRQFYDNMLPKRLMKLVKQHDPEAAKLVESRIKHSADYGFDPEDEDWAVLGEDSPTSEYQGEHEESRLPAIRITPRMRESILKRGFSAYASGGEVDDDDGEHVVRNPMSIFPKPQRMWDEDMPGGAYLSMPDKQDVTGHRAASASIGIGEGGKPYFNASRDAVDETGSPGRGSATVKTNLFKQKAGWKWLEAPEGHEDTNTIVSVEHRGKHHYVMSAHFPKGVDLSRYPNAPSEPRLRPTTKGNVELGPQVGSIVVRGKEHPVHAHAIVKAGGGEVEGDDHPLTQDVYHGTRGENIGPAMAQAVGYDTFSPRHPGDVEQKPNATALMLGPHVARDPNISGDYRFTTGEHSLMVPGEREGTFVRKRVGERAQGQVKMLRTFPDEKFFPVSQPTAHQTLDDVDYPRQVRTHDWDDHAVHRLVMSTVFPRHPELFKKAISETYETDPEEFLQRNRLEDLTEENVDRFFRNNSMRIQPATRQQIVSKFRKIMGDMGYAGLSYLNTDEDETENAQDKKCYIVFPQREKETGWSPLRNRYAKFDPARKGRPGLHEARGGAVDGYADGGMPEDPMQSIARAENAPGVTVSARPGKMGGYPVRMGTMDDHEPWSFTTPEGEEMPSPPPIQHPVFNEPRLDRLHKATAPIFKSKGFNDLVEDITGLRGLTIKPIVGTWKGEPEPSFHISHPDMTAEHVQKLAPLLGFGFQQDAAVHHHHNPDPENEGFPTAYIGKSGKMTKRDLDRVIEAAQREGIDFSQTSDGRGVKFSHFSDDGEEFKEFGNAVARVADAVKFPHRHYVRSSGDLQNAQDYLTGVFGSGEGAHGESGLHGGSARSPDLFGRIVDHVLAPYAKAVASEGYRLSPERLAETYGLSPEETEKVRSAMLPSKGDRTTIPLMEGREQLDIRPTGNRGKPTVGDVLFALQNRAANKGQVDPGDYSDKASEKIASDIANEVKYHIDTAGKSAIGWYDSALKKAMRKYNVIFPELKSDAEKQTMFKAILGITSQGQDVFANSSHTAKLYSLIRDGMELPDAVKKLRGTFGDKTRAIEFNLNKLHELATNVGGYSNLHDMLGKTKTVSEWNKILRENPALNSGGKPLQMSGGKDQKVTGWMAFGPKIGSFINNLHGDFSTLTADLWFSRTWNRLLGHNFIHTPAAEAKQYRDFRDALIAEHAARNPDQALAEASPHKTSNGVVKTNANGDPEPWLHGNDVAGMDRDEFDSLVNDPDKMLSYATEIERRYRKGQYKQKSDVRRRAKNWIENRELPVAAPRSDLEREFQQNTIEKAQKQLKRKGLNISVADIQAALWFHEKDLFRRLGVASEKAAPADYSDAASRTIRQMRPKMAVKALKSGGAAIDKAILISMRAMKKR